MKKTAILVDGAWFTHALKAHLRPLPNGVTADIIYRNALACSERKDEEIFRVFYYDSLPYDRTSKNPVSQTVTDYSKTASYSARQRLFKELSLEILTKVVAKCGNLSNTAIKTAVFQTDPTRVWVRNASAF